jgi:hypothetical protein
VRRGTREDGSSGRAHRGQGASTALRCAGPRSRTLSPMQEHVQQQDEQLRSSITCPNQVLEGEPCEPRGCRQMM